MIWKVKIGGTWTEEVEVQFGAEAGFIRVHLFDEPIPVAADDQLVLCGKFKTDDDDRYFFCRWDCDGYKDIENKHMGLFTIEHSDEESYNTGTYGGQFPRVYYHLD